MIFIEHADMSPLLFSNVNCIYFLKLDAMILLVTFMLMNNMS